VVATKAVRRWPGGCVRRARRPARQLRRPRTRSAAAVAWRAGPSIPPIHAPSCGADGRL